MRRVWILAASVALSCGKGNGGGGGDGTESDDAGTMSTTASTSSPTTTDGTTTDSTTTAGPKLDVGFDTESGTDTEDPQPTCKVVDDMNAVGECEESAPADSFEPDVQWIWEGPDPDRYSITTPLVANLTDDNDDGEIDLCDIPDVIVNAYTSLSGEAHLYVLDGETGALHFVSQDTVHGYPSFALGDIDNDGLPELVAIAQWDFQVGGRIRAFEHDGTVKWTGDVVYSGVHFAVSAIGLADLDNDGDVEIYGHNWVTDHDGNLLWTAAATPTNWSASAAADLDGDGDLELVIGHAAYHHDGSQYYLNNGVAPGFPQIADLDNDPQPEVLLLNPDGISMLEHDGSTKFQDLTPTGPPIDGQTWLRPATVHDFDGDGVSEFAVSSETFYSVYEADATIVWSSPVLDATGIAAGTAFDFLGDGDAEAMYADETTLFIFDGMGNAILQVPRSSLTVTEYPVVADVDNDGSAEIVVTSNQGPQTSPTVQVIRDIEDRWIQARRIWNQHTYHVTNVREDGTIPQNEQPSWTLLNTYRTNAQIEGGGLCKPDPRG